MNAAMLVTVVLVAASPAISAVAIPGPLPSPILIIPLSPNPVTPVPVPSSTPPPSPDGTPGATATPVPSAQPSGGGAGVVRRPSGGMPIPAALAAGVGPGHTASPASAAAPGAGQPPAFQGSGQLAIVLGALTLVTGLALLMLRRGFVPGAALRFHSAPRPGGALSADSERLALPGAADRRRGRLRRPADQKPAG